MMITVRIQLRILFSGIVWGALLIALLLLGLALVLEKWYFVEKVQAGHILLIYGMVFPLITVLIFSQLFAEEIEEGIVRWILSLPVRGWQFLAERWAIGTFLVLMIHSVSWLVMHIWVISLPWVEFALHTLPPAIWLGNLAILAALAGRNYAAGLAVPLFYWVFEALSKGMVSQNLYLFMTSLHDESVFIWNRSLMLVFAGLALLLSAFVLTGKRRRRDRDG